MVLVTLKNSTVSGRPGGSQVTHGIRLSLCLPQNFRDLVRSVNREPARDGTVCSQLKAFTPADYTWVL